MKTTQQINSIKTLKRLIAETVTAHKALKEQYGRTESYFLDRQRLFVAYTLYYMLRHEIEDVDAYIKSVYDHLTLSTKQTYNSWGYPTWLRNDSRMKRVYTDYSKPEWSALKDAVLKMKDNLFEIVPKESSDGDEVQG
jgi:hypothetical protein